MDPSLEDLVAEFLERRESGEKIEAEVFAALHPERRGELLAALERVERVERMFPREDAPSTTAIGKWRVVRELGSGGSGRVFEVEDPNGGPRRALKLLGTTAALDPRQEARFRREAAILREFEHPGVVRVHELGEHGGCPFLVMDLVEGASLAEIVHRARHASSPTEPRADRLDLPGVGSGAERAARLVARTARTMAAAHRSGLIHRDLKPSNILLRGDGEPVVVDFGLARRGDAATLTGSGDVLGTPHFMAPEQASGRAGDHRVDVYGLGAVLYELLTLEVPHPGSDALAVLQAVRRAPPRPPRRVDPAVPRRLESIVRRAMAFRPSRRFDDADLLAQSLEEFAGHRSAGRSTLSFSARLEDLWRWHRGRAAMAAALLLVGITLWALFGPDPAGDHEAAALNVALGEVCVEEERWADAAEAFEKAARLVGDDAELWHRAAKNHLKSRNAEARARALFDLSRAFELAGSDVPPTYRRTLAAATDRPEEAIRILEELVAEYPRNVSLRFNLAFVYHREHRLAEAARHYKEADEAAGGYSRSLVSLAWIHSGMDDSCSTCKAELERHPDLLDFDLAERYMLRSMALDGAREPGTIETLVGVARRIGREGALAAAVREWMASPDVGEAHMGRLARALQELE